MSNWIFYHLCKRKDLKDFKKYNLVPIGKKFRSVNIKVIKNELVVNGPMISNGYIEKKLNNKKFILNKLNNTFYTGDSIKKYLGKYICIGRKDNMVKIRGYRIEIPYVEAIIRKLSFVDEAIVIEKKELDYSNYLIGIVKLNKKIEEYKIKAMLENNIEKYILLDHTFFLQNE